MKKLYRIIDANLNRVSEGLRVLEDIERFKYEDEFLAKELKELRHSVRKSFTRDKLIVSRRSLDDVGFNISQASNIDKKSSIDDLIKSNFKRVEEGLRAIEEGLNLLGFYKESKLYEKYRFMAYDLERKVLMKDVLNTDIYAILGEEFSRGKSNLDVVKELKEAGIKIIQYREKEKSKSEIYKECLEISNYLKDSDIKFIVNDHVDIALAVDADGIHIGQEDLDVEIIKNMKTDLFIGLSTHNERQALKARELGVDYIGVGPIFPTKTKKHVEASKGLEYLKWVSENIDLPYVAIGGIKEDNIGQVKANGGYCFAMVSEILSSEDLVSKLKSIRRKI